MDGKGGVPNPGERPERGRGVTEKRERGKEIREKDRGRKVKR